MSYELALLVLASCKVQLLLLYNAKFKFSRLLCTIGSMIDAEKKKTETAWLIAFHGGAETFDSTAK